MVYNRNKIVRLKLRNQIMRQLPESQNHPEYKNQDRLVFVGLDQYKRTFHHSSADRHNPESLHRIMRYHDHLHHHRHHKFHHPLCCHHLKDLNRIENPYPPAEHQAHQLKKQFQRHLIRFQQRRFLK